MIKKSQGTIVVMSSVAGFSPLYARTAYAASKHALHGFFESLRSELVDDGVHIMMVCPSFIATQAKTRSAGDVSSDGLSRPGSAKEQPGNPMTADYVADKVLRAAYKKKTLLVIGRIAKLSWIISHLFPAFYEKKMLKNTKGELE
jgi:short-subunit dehydrogenase